MKKENLIALGEITKTRGLKGELKVNLYSGTLENLVDSTDFVIEDKAENLRRIKATQTRFHKKALLICFERYDSIEAADELVGCRIFTKAENLKTLPEGEYYWFELLGMEVVDRKGNVYGRISEILETGANDVYVCRQDRKEYCIPAVKEVILEVNRISRTLLIDPPEGLFDND